MKISFNWLRELVELPGGVSAADVAELLTNQGLEVEGTETVGGALGGVVVAEVLGLRPHPNADKLRIVRVRAGSVEEDVVCGAPNVPAPGGRVCWARPGTRLPGGLELTAREVRGVMSPGMLCSTTELGLGDVGESDGILILGPDAPHGVPVAQHLGLPDVVFEVNVTPNRPDALSHLGVAREVAAGLGLPLRRPTIDAVPVANDGPTVDVAIADPEACPRYVARVVTDLRVGPSPLWMRLRLAACGVRAISNLVDVTNYVMLELGHPLHAFDLDKISGGIVVRRAKTGERMTTLDGQDRALVAEDIVIADGRQAVALAGVMGGATSEVSDGTTRVLLEAATFHPSSVRKTSKRLGLSSEASYRFERGVDAESVAYAGERAAALLAKLGGGKMAAASVDRYVQRPTLRHVTLTRARLERVTGLPVASLDDAKAELTKVGFAVEHTGAGGAHDALVVTVPSFRPDVSLPEDLVEEVLRLSGAYRRPADAARVTTNVVSVSNPEGPADRARDLLAAAGLHEIVSWGFVPRAALEALAAGSREPAPHLTDGVVVRNPISADYEVMRTSLLPGLAAALGRNLSRGLPGAGLFEVGPVIRKAPFDGAPPEQRTVASGILAGPRPAWLKAQDSVDFFDVKTMVEDLLAGLGVGGAGWQPAQTAHVPFLHPGVSAEVKVQVQGDDRLVAVVGELHPKVARRLGLEVTAFFFEVELDALPPRQVAAGVSAPPRFPATTRDVSFWIDQPVTAAAVRAAFLAAGEPLLREVTPLEDFRDPKYLPRPDAKGMLWSMTYRADDRTLTDPEVDAAHARVIEALKSRHVISIR